jgi:ribosomal protein S12 methylthiotransferase
LKIFFISLGCDKNLVDSEKMIALLRDRGYEFTDEENEADVAVINSCCFVNDAKQESIDAILEVSELKKAGKLKCIVVAGCLAQRYADEIHEEIPEVDAIVGTTAFDKITDAVDEVLKGKKIDIREDIDRLANPEAERSITTEGDYEYLKIAEGCDKRCTYCIIPYVRGSFRSIPMESLLKDARELADKGVKELILVAQETTLYGVDIYGKKMLPELLRKLCQIEGLHWIRILYAYPEEVTEALTGIERSYRELPGISERSCSPA